MHKKTRDVVVYVGESIILSLLLLAVPSSSSSCSVDKEEERDANRTTEEVEGDDRDDMEEREDRDERDERDDKEEREEDRAFFTRVRVDKVATMSTATRMEEDDDCCWSMSRGCTGTFASMSIVMLVSKGGTTIRSNCPSNVGVICEESILCFLFAKSAPCGSVVCD